MVRSEYTHVVGQVELQVNVDVAAVTARANRVHAAHGPVVLEQGGYFLAGYGSRVRQYGQRVAHDDVSRARYQGTDASCYQDVEARVAQAYGGQRSYYRQRCVYVRARVGRVGLEHPAVEPLAGRVFPAGYGDVDEQGRYHDGKRQWARRWDRSTV